MRWKIGLFAVLATLSPHAASAAGAACPNPAFAREAQASIAAYDESGVFSGALLVAVNGQPVLRRGVGLANRELGVAATPQMKFRVGSVTKQFTATAILQLQEAGKLSIDDPISKYYPEAPAAWSKITLRHLLTHSSGIPSYTGLPGLFEREARLAHTPAEIIKLTRDKPLEFEPGAKFAYDNSGYILLGYVVEKVSGQPYADYVRDHVFGPLGMKGSGYDRSDEVLPGRVPGYQRTLDGALKNAAFLDMSVPYAAGSLYSTVDDLLTWDQALYAARPLKPASLTAMFTDAGNKYGFGFVIDRKWDQDRIWHNGGINGFTSSFQRYPKARVTVVALANQETGATDKLAADLAGLCLGAKVYPPVVAETPQALARYAGFYQVSPLLVAKVEVRGSGLVSHVAGQPDLLFYPQGDGKFFARTADVAFAFQTAADGKVTGFAGTQGGRPQPPAKRIDAAEAERVAKARAERIAAKVASPGTEAALRRLIGELQAGDPDYTRMSPALAGAMRAQAVGVKSMLARLGALKSLTFQSVGPGGADIFVAVFENGSLEWRIALGEGGRIDNLLLRPVAG